MAKNNPLHMYCVRNFFRIHEPKFVLGLKPISLRQEEFMTKAKWLKMKLDCRIRKEQTTSELSWRRNYNQPRKQISKINMEKKTEQTHQRC